MTRKQAIIRTIDVLRDAQIDDEEREELVTKLNDCIDDIPFTHWSKTAIFDACEQFILDHGRGIYTTDFNRAELPSHPTIQNRFKMSAAEFRDKHFPFGKNLTKGPLRNKTKDEWMNLFIEDFHRIKPTSSSMYNKNREKDLPTWITVARMFDIKCWADLLHHCGLTAYKRTNIVRNETNYFVSTISKSELELQRLSNNNS